MSSTTPGSDPDRPHDADDTGGEPDVVPEPGRSADVDEAPEPEPVSEPAAHRGIRARRAG